MNSNQFRRWLKKQGCSFETHFEHLAGTHPLAWMRWVEAANAAGGIATAGRTTPGRGVLAPGRATRFSLFGTRYLVNR